MTLQNRQAYLPSHQLISLAEAARLAPYTQEYLNLLCRNGKLQAVKIARNWLTTREAVFSFLEKQEHRHRQALQEIARVKMRAHVGSAGIASQ